MTKPVEPGQSEGRDVAVDVLAPVAVDTAYSYRAPSGLKLEPGQCVRMPLGAREATGVVWAVRPGGGDNLKSDRRDSSTGRRSRRPCAISSTGWRAGR